jgi:signal transduction histidine kinase
MATLLRSPPDALSHARVFIVDDQIANIRLLKKILARAGYKNLSGTNDSRQVASLFVNDLPDLLLLDLHMPHLDGYQVLELLGTLIPEETFLPVIVLTADVTPKAKHRALSSGACDFVSKPFDSTEVLLRVENALHMRSLHQQLQNQNTVLEQRVQDHTTLLKESLEELRRTQQQVVQQERLRALGMMATGVAHDFNNVLSLIMGYSELLLSETVVDGAETRTTKYLHTIIAAAHDAAGMVNRLAQFYRPPSKTDLRESVKLSQLLEQAVSLTMPRWKGQAMANGIDINIDLSLEEVPDITGDSAELRELLTNLIFNAVDAMPQGGTIWLRTRAEDQFVVLEIEDTGTGMSEEVRQRCLEPFFTTKGERGTGLGLAMIYGIIKRHNGTLDMKSRLGVGTKFEIRLPNQQAPCQEHTLVDERRSEPLKILAVDDQPALCEILVEYLQGDLHKVTTANSGEEALKRFREEDDFDLVITDKAMHGMSGVQFAAALRQLRPDVPIMLLTGFGESGSSASDSPDIDVVVGKPVNLTSLRQAISRVMSRSSLRQEQLEAAGSVQS